MQVASEAKARFGLADRADTLQPVLASFQVEQDGQQLRIVDADGSVYSGSLQLADAARRTRAAKPEAAASAPASRALGVRLEESAASGRDLDQLLSHVYAFRVAGTNRSLNKKIVFTGNLLPSTNLAPSPPAATNFGFAAGTAGTRVGAVQPVRLPLLNSRIAGKVVIGTGNAVEVNALPANP